MVAGKVFVLAGFTAVMAFLFYLLVTQNPIETRLECDRGEDVCRFGNRLLTRTSTAWEHLSAIERAGVRFSTGGRRAPVIAVWLKSREGDSYFDDYPTRGRADADADRINRFLRDPSEARFSLVRNHEAIYWTAWALGAVAAATLVFLGFVLFRPSREGRSDPLTR